MNTATVKKHEDDQARHRQVVMPELPPGVVPQRPLLPDPGQVGDVAAARSSVGDGTACCCALVM